MKLNTITDAILLGLLLLAVSLVTSEHERLFDYMGFGQ